MRAFTIMLAALGLAACTSLPAPPPAIAPPTASMPADGPPGGVYAAPGWVGG